MSAHKDRSNPKAIHPYY
uniref:Uncharacterized protein n=1 Tax=Lepeophtheirus salmonis TaxID=72036 RepID=A0A0K2U0B3_LEPSM